MNTDQFWEHQIFPGAIALISLILFMIIVLYKTYRSASGIKDKLLTREWVMLICTVLTFLFFIRNDTNSLYRIVFEIPGFNALRVVSRIINVELIFFAFATASVFAYSESKIETLDHPGLFDHAVTPYY